MAQWQAIFGRRMQRGRPMPLLPQVLAAMALLPMASLQMFFLVGVKFTEGNTPVAYECAVTVVSMCIWMRMMMKPASSTC